MQIMDEDNTDICQNELCNYMHEQRIVHLTSRIQRTKIKEKLIMHIQHKDIQYSTCCKKYIVTAMISENTMYAIKS